MPDVINSKKVVTARKEYEDSNRWFIMDALDDGLKEMATPEELQLIGVQIAAGWKIKRGDRYEHSVLKHEYMIYQWRTMPGLDAICAKYELWPEE